MTTTTTTTFLPDLAATLANAGAALEAARQALAAIETNATREAERVGTLLAGLPALPAVDGPLGEALGLPEASAGLDVARSALQAHGEGLTILAQIAGSQAGRLGQIATRLQPGAPAVMTPTPVAGIPATTLPTYEEIQAEEPAVRAVAPAPVTAEEPAVTVAANATAAEPAPPPVLTPAPEVDTPPEERINHDNMMVDSPPQASPAEQPAPRKRGGKRGG